MAHVQQELILVDATDRVLGSADRGECHRGDGRLHRAFSILVFDPAGRLLIQQRSPHKLLWPGSWSNSCCGHPLAGEELEQAAERRLFEEFGFRTALQRAFRFEYAAAFGEHGSERELCTVFLGRHAGEVRPAPEEIADWRFESARDLARSLGAEPQRYTPWFRVIWRVLGLPAAAWSDA